MTRKKVRFSDPKQVLIAHDSDHVDSKLDKTRRLKRLTTALKSADPAKEIDEKNLLHWAAFYKKEHLVKACIDAGADIYKKNKHNLQPIQCTDDKDCCLHLKKEHKKNSLKLALASHQPARVINQHHLLSWAAYYGWPNYVNACLQAGANPNLKDNTGYTPYQNAKMGGDSVCIILLRPKPDQHHRVFTQQHRRYQTFSTADRSPSFHPKYRRLQEDSDTSDEYCCKIL